MGARPSIQEFKANSPLEMPFHAKVDLIFVLPDSLGFIQESPVRVILAELRSGVPVKYRGGSHVNGLLIISPWCHHSAQKKQL